MGRKKSKSSQPDFKNNPFKNLRGLSVSGPEQGPEVSSPPKSSPVSAPAGESETETDFASAMARLGVDQLGREDSRPRQKESEGPATKNEAGEESDQALFLAALGHVDKQFRDELPEESPPQPPPRRMKQLRQGRLRVEAELDLHGLDRRQALERVERFIAESALRGWVTLNIITGQGLHSAEGPVLRDALEAWLRAEPSAAVAEWGRAPKQFGGAGALILFLRRRLKQPSSRD